MPEPMYEATGKANPPYFHAFLHRQPPQLAALAPLERAVWQTLAATTLGLALWYLHWRWTQSLNPEALAFSVLVATAETLTFVGSAIFFFDIWDEGDTPTRRHSASAPSKGLPQGRDIKVDIFITTFDEDLQTVTPTVEAAKALSPMTGVTTHIFLLDDGDRPDFRSLAKKAEISYLSRTTNRGYKAGNLANALFASEGDFFVICDADTQLFPDFLHNTLNYFADPKVSWVQTPHWFYEIPDGQPWADWAQHKWGRSFRFLGKFVTWTLAKPNKGSDPFLCESLLFFDVIQRRRNRHGASFCCGAGSIHRREAVFQCALASKGKNLRRLGAFSSEHFRALLPRLDLQPFKFHVSEDLYTSLLHHEHGWTSIYHPQIEARMLSPWSMRAWAMQRLKYAGGTFDIMLRCNPFFQSSSMRITQKLHYLATFWSYLSVLWLPILLLAPVISIAFGRAPVTAYSIDFFLHLLPVLLFNELAMMIGCKGHDLSAGRIASIGAMHINLRAFFHVLHGQKPRFAPTPKTPGHARNLAYVKANFIFLVIILCTVGWALYQHIQGSEGYSRAFLTMNLFWLTWSGWAIWRVMRIAFWLPPRQTQERAAKC